MGGPQSYTGPTAKRKSGRTLGTPESIIGRAGCTLYPSEVVSESSICYLLGKVGVSEQDSVGYGTRTDLGSHGIVELSDGLDCL